MSHEGSLIKSVLEIDLLRRLCVGKCLLPFDKLHICRVISCFELDKEMCREKIPQVKQNFKKFSEKLDRFLESLSPGSDRKCWWQKIQSTKCPFIIAQFNMVPKLSDISCGSVVSVRICSQSQILKFTQSTR